MSKEYAVILDTRSVILERPVLKDCYNFKNAQDSLEHYRKLLFPGKEGVEFRVGAEDTSYGVWLCYWVYPCMYPKFYPYNMMPRIGVINTDRKRLPVAVRINTVRSELGNCRSSLQDIIRDNPCCAPRIEYAPHAATCLISALYSRQIEAEEEAYKLAPTQGIYYSSRGIGSDSDLTCFICGVDHRFRGGEGYICLPNISGFVKTKEDGEAIVEMFGLKAAWLDYRPATPKRIQVKIGACNEHFDNLRLLERMISRNNHITPGILDDARRLNANQTKYLDFTDVTANKLTEQFLKAEPRLAGVEFLEEIVRGREIDKEPNFGNKIKLEGVTHRIFDKETNITIARFNIRGYGGTKGTIAGLNYKGNGGFFLSIEEAINPAILKGPHS